MAYIQMAVIQGRKHEVLREVQIIGYVKFENGKIISPRRGQVTSEVAFERFV